MKRLTLFILCVLLAACDPPGKQSAQQLEPRVSRVMVAQPTLRDIEDVLTAMGSVESINTPTVSAETSGQAIEIAVREGDTVEPGQLLAALDSTLHAIESAKAEAETRRLDVLVKNQEDEVKRLQRLSESQSVSRDKLEDEQAQLAMLVAQRDIAQKQWEQFQYMASKTRVEAPIGGLVTRRHISLGDYVVAGQPLFDLVSVERLRARIAFPEHAASRIAVGKEVRLTSPDTPYKSAVGTVATVNPQINTHSRALEITVEFDNPGGWMPGASADATLVAERREQALTLPLKSFVKRDGQDVVFVLAGRQVRAVQVNPGWREGDWAELSGQITATDTVVVEGADQLSDGSLVDTEAAAP
ncbi:MAG: efflux RND transporter periplasmic adaptor subunit [Halioglobus sp.]|nr:efflux RND transporter periplasmic adaptor subunit [Halioglobus sp.]